jgi:hypothetical protein
VAAAPGQRKLAKETQAPVTLLVFSQASLGRVSLACNFLHCDQIGAYSTIYEAFALCLRDKYPYSLLALNSNVLLRAASPTILQVRSALSKRQQLRRSRANERRAQSLAETIVGKRNRQE